MPPYEFFDHTADIGIKAQASSLPDLFTALARGLTELIAEDSRLQPLEDRAITLSAADAPSLLYAWLKELLFWFSTDRFLPVEFMVEEVTPTRLRGRVRGERFDPSRHIQGREVKAITQHWLEVRQQGGGWYGQVIVDI